MSKSEDILSRDKALDTNFADFSAGGRHNRRVVRSLVAAVIIDILLSISVGFVVLQNHANEVTIRNNAITSCQQGNQTRAGDVYLWDSILNVVAKPNSKDTPAQQAATEAFVKLYEAKVKATFAPEKCLIPLG